MRVFPATRLRSLRYAASTRRSARLPMRWTIWINKVTRASVTRLRALIHEGRQQGHANGLGMLTNMGRGFSGDASAQAFYQPGCVPSKQIRWQANGPQRA